MSTDDLAGAIAAGDHAAGYVQSTGQAHAVLRSTADLPPPWAAICGASVDVVQGKWDGRRGLGSANPCPDCRRLTGH
ncbi:hypothetical protein [Blastococcus sp. TF02A-30]|uniref:hypothetical protein n=1 Tax=Blastococcus sp. TF02A-30 TaxID=2250580 RepID=UPI000DE97067|nr:hypothetical protein [Blastococcus sp. TF02A-30]RBY87601.1 hypothetical protein DQ241_09840 [Blastococcus sp. TF02A-30]